VQRRRWLPVAGTQALQRLVQRHGVERVLHGGVPPDCRWMLNSGGVRTVLSRLIGVGIRPEHVRLAAPKAPEVPAVLTGAAP
jgi:hypothetical protein